MKVFLYTGIVNLYILINEIFKHLLNNTEVSVQLVF